ncbi:hypothetical protein BOX15_Mlig026658g1 [Macrostomum lignano]|nr:hypothetical protein BOX15_Mlig026658g3 [Macrostomum lignano]PAA55617.1 hypothetical protein BOX15_Mlig026658g2 [Macrostomum lignano]PAA56204.1 hypothetical protein BOX15_Mlig026658g1 [Macrostomum lignano]
MALEPHGVCHTLCIKWSVAKIIYLLSGSLIVCGFTVEMIVIGMIVAPYLREAEFVEASCQFNSSRYTGYTDCQDVNRKPNNNFPCLEVLVNFFPHSSSKLPVNSSKLFGGGVATIYSVLSYYEESSSTSKCSSRICYRDSYMNAKQIANLNVTLYNNQAAYQCYVRQEWAASTFVALRSREIDEAKVFHCLLWPALAFGFGGLVFWSVYCCLGCNIWPKEMAV